MTSCADLDPFFDGELSEEAAAVFREHLAGCSRCQVVLRGRMQEEAVIGEQPESGAYHRVAGGRPAQGARRHVLVYLAPVLAVAAAVAIWLVGTRGEPATNSARFGAARPSPPVEVALAIEHRGVAMRSGAGVIGEARASMAVGDLLRLTVRGESYRAIWVYFEDQDLVVACPGGPGCRSAEEMVTLEFRVPDPGWYSAIAIGSAQPIVAPRGSLDVMLSKLSVAGAHFEIRRVNVN